MEPKSRCKVEPNKNSINEINAKKVLKSEKKGKNSILQGGRGAIQGRWNGGRTGTGSAWNGQAYRRQAPERPNGEQQKSWRDTSRGLRGHIT